MITVYPSTNTLSKNNYFREGGVIRTDADVVFSSAVRFLFSDNNTSDICGQCWKEKNIDNTSYICGQCAGKIIFNNKSSVTTRNFLTFVTGEFQFNMHVLKKNNC
ncbi:hypothetical protein KUTeg_025073 [Tegillarca granosa]|uniref:Uncharacterized protein n=1 Tax=Tegillarca granosa TaxID=220873 RepID=A0ABQ9E4Q7_TEGGR|nr:hypothetical protein KUTeg_025073 [Tegillarca granosa]